MSRETLLYSDYLVCDWSVQRTAIKPQGQWERNVVRMLVAVLLGERWVTSKKRCEGDYKWVSSFLKTMSSEIEFPMTLTSGAFVNKKCNKQTSHELQNNLDSSCISFCISSRKRQFKTSQDDTKLSQLQLSVSKFPDAAKIFRINSPVKFWPIRT